jgi:hypothetical protein
MGVRPRRAPTGSRTAWLALAASVVLPRAPRSSRASARVARAMADQPDGKRSRRRDRRGSAPTGSAGVARAEERGPAVPIPPSTLHCGLAFVAIAFVASAAAAGAFGFAVFRASRPGAGDAVVTLGRPALDIVAAAAFFMAFPLTWVAFRTLRPRPTSADAAPAVARRRRVAIDLAAVAFLAVWLVTLLAAAGRFASVAEGQVIWRPGVWDAVRRAPLSSVAEVRLYDLKAGRGRWLPRVDVRFADGTWLRGDAIPANAAGRDRFVHAITWLRDVPVRHDGRVDAP